VRFENPRQLMSYSGLVLGEHSSGNRVQRGAIIREVIHWRVSLNST
jgi:transposase